MTDPIKIEGLNEFVRNLKKIDNDLPKMVRVAFNDAADVVVTDARPRVPRRSGKARKSVRSRSTRTAARVSGGGKRAPHYPWLDFGGRVGKGKSIKRPFKTEGRYIYRSYYEARDSGEFERVMVKALIGVVESAGIEVS